MARFYLQYPIQLPIVLDKFLTPIPNGRIFVMSTYIAAQYLMMRGILKQFEKETVN